MINKEELNDLNNVEVVILCGGKGTRISPVIGDKPKVLADINGRTFLEIFIEQLVSHGFKKIILSVGYLKDQIKDYVQKGELEKQKKCKIYFSEEEISLGTGGAIKNAEKFIENDHFLVINGDTFSSVNFKDFYKYHFDKNALISMAVVNNKNSSDYGSIEINDKGEIIGFFEKKYEGAGIISAGMYFMDKKVFNLMPEKESFSLEKDFFSKVIKNNFFGFIHNGDIIDIGTPERYEKAKNILNKI